MKGKGFLICPVRSGDVDFSRQYVEILEAQGWEIHWPPRDTKQNDPTGYRICSENLAAIKASDRVFIAWDGESQGSLFDAGMAFALGKDISVLASPPLKGSKSFQDIKIISIFSPRNTRKPRKRRRAFALTGSARRVRRENHTKGLKCSAVSVVRWKRHSILDP